MLGSNDPNTILDPTWIQCSHFCSSLCFRLDSVSVLDLATFYVPLDSILSGYVSHDFLDICFIFYLLLLPYVSLACTMFHLFTFSDSAVTLNPTLLYFAYCTQILHSSPAPAHPLISIYILYTCVTNWIPKGSSE